MRRTCSTLTLTLTLTLAVGVAGPTLAAAPPAPAVDHGAEVAQRCAACHAVGREGASPNNGAPPFRKLTARYNPIGLEKALKRIGRFGHFEMRPQQMSDADMADLAAYIASLEAPPAGK
ncbi:c-type cytochrome [Phenylobacterium soli]|uniref:Cytochrome c n=1 Tax=Phenylobacterium soli TaxID=2170551 RepID=A0A328AGX3_9CAUL|nr:c-type cytochrome [Phenylobacterium soli]RAK54022.1 cytochrome c [Phenylobacterium soli]